MKRKPLQLDILSLLAGAAIGAGTVLWRNAAARRNPDEVPDQKRVNRALEARLRQARKAGKIRLEPDHRYVIFSDHHKGARNLADDFHKCEASYLAALDHYYEKDYSLIVLGDAEELLEERIDNVLAAYRNVLQCEARFHPNRLYRVVGNHDIFWQVEEVVREHLEPYFPGIQYYQELVLEYADGDQTTGDIFLVHGHQGTLDSDLFGFLAQYVLPYYRDIQILTGIGRTLPSQDACLRSEHDNHLYRWASQQSKLILIAGHTHRPVWSSLTHLEQLNWQLYHFQQLRPEERPADYEERLASLRRQIQERQEKYPPCTDMIKTKPCYFNTGCCRFEDGDITGIELENGMIRLIKWGLEEGSATRNVLEETRLSQVFYFL